MDNEKDRIQDDRLDDHWELMRALDERITELEERLTEMNSCYNCKHSKVPSTEEPCVSCVHVAPPEELSNNWEREDEL